MNINEMIQNKHIGLIVPKDNQNTDSISKAGMQMGGVIAWSGWVLVTSIETTESEKTHSILPTLA
ncbi:MAG TPA: hypothetical protein VK121_09080 [Pseudogracilibacillus sp.]|nr:hypothetical protein [Pseudogracilibacillus sp.]